MRRNDNLTCITSVEYLLSKLFLLPEGATVSFRGCIKQTSRLDACSKSRKNGCFFTMRERHQLTIQPVCLLLLVVFLQCFSKGTQSLYNKRENHPPLARLFSYYKYPFSFKLTYLPVWETIKWSKTSIPIIFPASANRFVTSMSSLLGLGHPMTIREAALFKMEHFSTSLGWTTLAFRLPTCAR